MPKKEIHSAIFLDNVRFHNVEQIKPAISFQGKEFFFASFSYSKSNSKYIL